tara:strand:- start:45 stop:320 length:276 start_codon:yes stop_codon:yes gene_type:complete
MLEETHRPVIGKNLKSARKRTFPNDTQFDAALRIGVSRATYQKMEKGDLSISLGAYLSAADIYSSTDDFNTLFNKPVESTDLFEEFGVDDE